MDGLIRLPPDATNLLSDVEAEVGLVQLERYPAFEAERRAHARFYREHLAPPADWVLPPDVEGATYSHFPVRVADRAATLRRFLKAGIQLGQLIEYSVPHLSEYGPAPASAFPNAWDGSRHTINLPVHPGLSEADRARIVEQVNGLAATMPAASSVTT
jgi:dTDP-4-amino-4,6-dideoxygalactose transaminase